MQRLTYRMSLAYRSAVRKLRTRRSKNKDKSLAVEDSLFTRYSKNLSGGEILCLHFLISVECDFCELLDSYVFFILCVLSFRWSFTLLIELSAANSFEANHSNHWKMMSNAIISIMDLTAKQKKKGFKYCSNAEAGTGLSENIKLNYQDR